MPERSTTIRSQHQFIFHQPAQGVLTRKVDWEVDTSQHDRKQDVPTKNTSDECERASRFLTLVSDSSLALGTVEEGASKKTECGYEREEDEEED